MHETKLDLENTFLIGLSRTVLIVFIVVSVDVGLDVAYAPKTGFKVSREINYWSSLFPLKRTCRHKLTNLWLLGIGHIVCSRERGRQREGEGERERFINDMHNETLMYD